MEKTPVEDGAAKKRPRRKAVAKKAASGKRANPGETASSARAVATGPSLPLGPVALDTPAERLSAMQTAAECLGISELYPEQVEVIDAVVTGQDVLMVLPTGFGKSACYQIPSLILNKPVLVISPLLALMRDQYEKLLKLGVPCIRLDGTIRGKKRAEALKRIRTGEPVLVMTTPETLGASDASEALAHSGLVDGRSGRGPLHLRVGLRLPAGLPADRRAAADVGWGSGSRPDGHGHREGAKRDSALRRNG